MNTNKDSDKSNIIVNGLSSICRILAMLLVSSAADYQDFDSLIYFIRIGGGPSFGYLILFSEQ